MKIVKCILLFSVLVILFSPAKKPIFIAEQDRAALEAFFRVLLIKNNFAYTLFGSKPCSFATAGHHQKIAINSALNNFDTVILRKGWECWQKYAHQYSNSNYLLQLSENSNVMTVTLINKQALKDTLKEHQNLLPADLTAEKLFEMICKDASCLDDFNRYDLTGIVLGYGVNNALAFEKKIKLCHQLNSSNELPFQSFTSMLLPENANLVSRLKNDDAFENVEPLELVQELNNLRFETFELADSDFFIEQFQLPSFAVLSKDPETIHLQQEYANIRENLTNVYKNKSFLETTLNQLLKEAA